MKRKLLEIWNNIYDNLNFWIKKMYIVKKEKKYIYVNYRERYYFISIK